MQKIAMALLVGALFSGSLATAQPAVAAQVSHGSGGKTGSAAVGVDGTVITGASPDGTRAVSVLLFTEGNAAGSIEFEGPAKDPVPLDMITEYGQKQDAAIKESLIS
jgi:hypothetical protein